MGVGSAGVPEALLLPAGAVAEGTSGDWEGAGVRVGAAVGDEAPSVPVPQRLIKAVGEALAQAVAVEQALVELEGQWRAVTEGETLVLLEAQG